MLSYLGGAAEITHSQDCTRTDLTTHACCTFSPITQSMSYIANALASRPTSAKSMVSFTSTPASSVIEKSTPEDVSNEDFTSDDTNATSVTTVAKVKRASISSVKSKPKTVFHLAHPPPVSIHKQHLHIRPRVLLQLQSTTGALRPTPVLEVLPSFVFASRLARLFPRTFKGKACLGADDLVVVSSENYKSDGPEVGEADGVFEADKWDEREIVAAICQPTKDEVDTQAKTQVCLSNGSLWSVSRLASGAYEFTMVDEKGLRSVARWVPKQSKGLQRTSTVASERSSSEEKKFNFSLINPNSRRHAVIACMDRHSIDVSAQYTDPPISPSSPASSTPTTTSSSASPECRWGEPVEVSQSLRSLITVTGICVAFHEGFSTHFRHSDKGPASPNLGTKQQRRSLVLNSNSSGIDQPSSPPRSSFSQGQKARGTLLHTNSSSAVPLSPASSQVDTPRRRTMSTTGAFLHRIKSRNISGSNTHQLSPVGDYDGSDTERVSTIKNGRRTSIGSSIHSSAASSRTEEGSPLKTIPASSFDIAEEKLGVTLGATTKKPKRLSKIFGSSRPGEPPL